MDTAYDFLFTFHRNHGPILYRFQNKINGGFSRKSQNFPLRVLCATAEVVPLELTLDTIHERDGQRDRRTDIGRQQKPRLYTQSCAVIILISWGLYYWKFINNQKKNSQTKCRLTVVLSLYIHNKHQTVRTIIFYHKCAVHQATTWHWVKRSDLILRGNLCMFQVTKNPNIMFFDCMTGGGGNCMNAALHQVWGLRVFLASSQHWITSFTLSQLSTLTTSHKPVFSCMTSCPPHIPITDRQTDRQTCWIA